MKNKIKVILGYLLGLFCSLLIVLGCVLLIIEVTVYNKSYAYNVINKNNYYNNVHEDIREEMENYMVSSGFPFEILNDIYTIDDVKDDINAYIDNLYLGSKVNINKDKVKDKLNNNIETYLKEHNVTVINESDITSFVDDIGTIYEKEVTLYHTFDSFLIKFRKINSLINVGLIIIGVVLLFSMLILIKYIKGITVSSCLIAAGVILLFLRMVIVEKVDIENILIVTEDFSNILIIILLYIRKLLLNGSIILIVLGLITLTVSSVKNKRYKVLN